MLKSFRKSPDILIVGGGPAGLAAAIALRQRGAIVTVADARGPSLDKVCGEGMMPDSVRELASLGVDVSVGEGAEFHGIRFVGETGSDTSRNADMQNGGEPGQVTARFQEGTGKEGTGKVGAGKVGAGLGLRRVELHRRMVDRAQEAGARLCWQSQVSLDQDGSVRLNGERASYGLLVGADGQSSQVRRWAGLEANKFMIQRFGFRQHFAVPPASSEGAFVDVHWGRSGQAYVAPVAQGVVCVVSMARDVRVRMKDVLSELPWVAKMTPVDTERGCVMRTRRLQQVARGRVALVGDASGSVDAITGEGLALGFRQAMMLEECLEAGTIEEGLERYDSLHPRTLLVPQIMARAMLLMDGSATLRKRALRMMFREPVIFARMLGLHLGEETLSHYVATQAAPVAWGIATATQSVHGGEQDSNLNKELVHE